MAPRAYWRGYLKLFLVSCPVRLYSATTKSTRISFNLLHKDTHNRIQMRPHDPELGEVDRADLIKGYEFEKDRYVTISDDDLEKVQIESSKTIAIDSFVNAGDIPSIYLDSPYFVAPDGAVADETFRVIHEAMKRKKKAALARVVLSSRERQVALNPHESGILMTALRSADEVRDAAPYFEEIGSGALDSEMIELAEQIIDQKATKFDPARLEDRYEKAVVELVQAKIKGQEPVVAKPPEQGKVINLMDALRRSLKDDQGQPRKPPAKSKRPAKKKEPARARSRRAG